MPLYSDTLALELAEHAKAVYLDAHPFERWTWTRDFDRVTIITRGSTQVGIAAKEDRIVVAARGSSSFGDWGENLLAFRLPWRALFPAGSLHVGFQIQARRIQAEFRDTMRCLRDKYPAAAVYVTGHSLGAALCPFLAAMLRLDGIEPRAVYTFESPRVGNRAWSTWYDSTFGAKTFRVVHIERGCPDIITRIPPSILGWWHAGQPVLICDGYRFTSESMWEKARAEHKVSALAWWRVLSRLAHGAMAHKSGLLVEELRRIATKALV